MKLIGERGTSSGRRIRMSERRLILRRHAKSDWSGQQADIDRPLGERGVRQAPRSGRWLLANIRRITLAGVSSAERARHLGTRRRRV